MGLDGPEPEFADGWLRVGNARKEENAFLFASLDFAVPCCRDCCGGYDGNPSLIL